MTCCADAIAGTGLAGSSAAASGLMTLEELADRLAQEKQRALAGGGQWQLSLVMAVPGKLASCTAHQLLAPAAVLLQCLHSNATTGSPRACSWLQT